eukprot:scaffold20584_cov51-Phaeocystis_antarctica.AAC.2
MRELTTRRSRGRARRCTNQTSNPNPDPDPSPSPNPNPNPSPNPSPNPNPNQAHQSDLFGLALPYYQPPTTYYLILRAGARTTVRRLVYCMCTVYALVGLALVRRWLGLANLNPNPKPKPSYDGTAARPRPWHEVLDTQHKA